MKIDKYFPSLRNLANHYVKKNVIKTKQTYSNFKHIFIEASRITQAHFDVLRMLITA